MRNGAHAILFTVYLFRNDVYSSYRRSVSLLLVLQTLPVIVQPLRYWSEVSSPTVEICSCFVLSTKINRTPGFKMWGTELLKVGHR